MFFYWKAVDKQGNEKEGDIDARSREDVVTILKKQGYFDPEVVQLFLQKNAQGQEDYNYQIWALLTFSLWHQIFIDKTITI